MKSKKFKVVKVKKPRSIEVFMDGIDFQHEIGHAMGGNTVYADLEDALKNNPCAKSCGIVKVKVELVEWVQDQNFDKAEYITVTPEEMQKSPDLQRLECWTAHQKFLENKVKNIKANIKSLKEKIKNGK